MRRAYGLGELLESQVDADPVVQFQTWLAQATEAGLPEPNAMVLATADADGRPSARTVLLKRVDESGGVHDPEKVLLRPRLIVRESCGSGSRERR